VSEPRTLHAIAFEIVNDWKRVHYAAKPYLMAMMQLERTTDMYGCDTAHSIVLYFLSNAATWRGEVARRVKRELKTMVGVK
jgi:hypothetical protein